MQRHTSAMAGSEVVHRRWASLCRRLAFASRSCFFFDRLVARSPCARFGILGDWPIVRIPAHAARLGFDLLECLRTASRVPDIGNVELALLDVPRPVPQHPRYLAYWYDEQIHSMVGMHLGVDLIRHGGKYYVVENNIGPSLYARRRNLYDSPFDPLVSGIVSTARSLGFRRVVLIALRWDALYVDEFERAGRELGLSVTPVNCPFPQPGNAHQMVALPRPLAPETLYVIHAGLTTPVVRYIDDKWYMSRWLSSALATGLPAGHPIALPTTSDQLIPALEDHGPRWPNLVVKLAGSARSRDVFAARFHDVDEAREALGLNGVIPIPRPLRRGFAKSLLFGHDRVIYQAFIPPEVDPSGHAQMTRLHLFVSPLRNLFISAHLRVSPQPLPERVPSGIIRDDNAFIFNNAVYKALPGERNEELRSVADHLGLVVHLAIAQRFETGIRKADT